MLGRVAGAAGVLVLTLIVFYLSRYWFPTDLWPRDGLLGLEIFSPRGGLVRNWLRGTPLAPFELLLWAIGVVLLLSALQSLLDRLKS